MASVIYLVVKEFGEYSSWDKTNLAFFTDLKDAETYVAFLTENHQLSSEREAASFSIETIERGEVPTNASELLTTRRSEKEKREMEWNAEYDRKRADSDALAAKKKAEDEKTLAAEVNRFLDWWSEGAAGDSFFEQKRAAMLRSMKQPLSQYINQTNDKRAADWMTANKTLLV